MSDRHVAEALHLVLNDVLTFLDPNLRRMDWSFYRDSIRLLAIGFKKGLPVTKSFSSEVKAITEDESREVVNRVREAK